MRERTAEFYASFLIFHFSVLRVPHEFSCFLTIFFILFSGWSAFFFIFPSSFFLVGQHFFFIFLSSFFLVGQQSQGGKMKKKKKPQDISSPSESTQHGHVRHFRPSTRKNNRRDARNTRKRTRGKGEKGWNENQNLNLVFLRLSFFLHYHASYAIINTSSMISDTFRMLPNFERGSKDGY